MRLVTCIRAGLLWAAFAAVCLGQPVITTDCPLPSTMIGSPYSLQLTATGGSPPYTWAVQFGTLPPGLTLSPSGLLTGAAGGSSAEYAFTLRVSDGTNAHTDKPCNLRISGPFRLAPAALEFDAQVGGPPTSLQRISILSPSVNQGWTTQAITNDGERWLRATPSTGGIPGLVEVSADPLGLAPGVYTGRVVVASLGVGQVAERVDVTFRVNQSAGPALAAEPSGLNIAIGAGAVVTSRLLYVVNNGAGPGDYSAQALVDSSVNWLSLSRSSGTATPQAPSAITVNIAAGSLPRGVHRGRIRLVSAGDGAVIEVPVTLAIAGGQSAMDVSQTGVVFTAVAGGSVTQAQEIRVLATSGVGLNWQVDAFSDESGPPWLSAFPPAGFSGPSSPGSLTVQASHSGLNPGTYFGRVHVSAPGVDNSPRIVEAVLRVLPAGSNPDVQISPGSMVFLVAPDRIAPFPQTVRIENLGSAPAPLLYTLLGDSAPFVVSTTSGSTVGPGGVSELVVAVNVTGLSRGVRRAQLLVGGAGDQALRTVELVVIVYGEPSMPALPVPSRLASDTSCVSGPLIVAPVSPAPGFVVSAGAPAPLAVRVYRQSGDAVVNGWVSALFSNGGEALRLRSAGGGLWTGTWWISSRDSAPATITFFANEVLGASGCGQTVGRIAAAPDAPFLPGGSIVGAASFSQFAPVAQGSLVTIGGANLAEGEFQADGLPLPDRLPATAVAAAGRPVPILFAAELPAFSQINGQMPYDIPANVSVPVSVRTPAGVAMADVIVAEAQPAVFTLSQGGSGQGIIVHGDDQTLIADAAHPVPRGRTAVIYCEGLGTTSPAAVEGQAAPGGPFAQVARPVTVELGGVGATVDFVGLTPGFTGLYQINITIPGNAPAGPVVPVVVKAAGGASVAVTMGIQ